MENLLMRNDEFEVLLAMLDRLEVGQKRRLQAAFAAGRKRSRWPSCWKAL